MNEIAERALAEPDWIRGCPYNTPVGRLDETRAAREARVIAPE